MAMEVVWTRAFTPVMGTQAYSFALLLFLYLLATWWGTSRYRRLLQSGRTPAIDVLLAALPAAMLLPAVINDPRLVAARRLQGAVAVPSIGPLYALLGILTPRLVDLHGRGDAHRTGTAYALNVAGCVVGPLAASYLLLPALGANRSLAALAAPFLFIAVRAGSRAGRVWWPMVGAGAVFVALAALVCVSYGDPCALNQQDCIVRRDSTATVISKGTGRQLALIVNGSGMTTLTPITKFMAHLPLVSHTGVPKRALAICVGMGTTYRSLLTWGLQVRVWSWFRASSTPSGICILTQRRCVRPRMATSSSTTVGDI
jgi:spermidine synthase